MPPSLHDRTPSLSAYDSQGLVIRQVAYLRSVAGATAEALITRQQRDAPGRVVKQWDPRLASPTITSVFSLIAEVLETDSVDAGLDNETYVYADASADAGYNRRGQMVAINDPSGSVKLHSFALTGAALQESRTSHDGLSFSSQQNLSPLGAQIPVFPIEFDAAGNQLALPFGPLKWNSRNQLDSVTLARHPTGPHDTEQYRYSQDVRVHKRLETHTPSVSHFRDVRYLPDLEIRTRDNGEELHVIKLDTGAGHVTCLHWVKGKPTGIDQSQMRYILKDHLGSSLKEVDQLARLISEETYYPFGSTSTLAARSLIEVDYKFIRYSGKETDESGLVYYGQRYYAPWLQRWTQPDKAGTVDGLNLYRMTANNPINFIDEQGMMMQPAPATSAQVSISVGGSTSSSPRSSIADSVAQSTGTTALVDDPASCRPSPNNPGANGASKRR
ncbi:MULTISPECIES: RHS repeat-associated core domain-containing protein [unclassified Pseudomonas]|uniref:RHS repeat-associated core domain-containing protein n=1 Tax=unclassified Pseudomonas TaxID=196821 RepID=UPI000A1DD33B|nr:MULTISPECIES: RHS repeat-associated core domain-containing protein [unclassified Pseudomonas]